jgi:hypothetical protein
MGVVVTRNGNREPVLNAWSALGPPARVNPRATLHLWTQVVGKVGLTLVPMTHP